MRLSLLVAALLAASFAVAQDVPTRPVVPPHPCPDPMPADEICPVWEVPTQTVGGRPIHPAEVVYYTLRLAVGANGQAPELEAWAIARARIGEGATFSEVRIHGGAEGPYRHRITEAELRATLGQALPLAGSVEVAAYVTATDARGRESAPSNVRSKVVELVDQTPPLAPVLDRVQ